MYTKKIYFSGGDFHELQEVFANVTGVVATKTGYINADGEATYESVASGKVSAVMGVEAEYNPKKTDLSILMDILFAVVNPYEENGQGKCKGAMYACGVYYASAEDEPQIELHINFIANRGKKPAVSCVGLTVNDPESDVRLMRKCYVRALKLKNFSPAEEAHQNFLKKNPDTETFIDFAKLKEYVKL